MNSEGFEWGRICNRKIATIRYYGKYGLTMDTPGPKVVIVLWAATHDHNKRNYIWHAWWRTAGKRFPVTCQIVYLKYKNFCNIFHSTAGSLSPLITSQTSAIIFFFIFIVQHHTSDCNPINTFVFKSIPNAHTLKKIVFLFTLNG